MSEDQNNPSEENTNTAPDTTPPPEEVVQAAAEHQEGDTGLAPLPEGPSELESLQRKCQIMGIQYHHKNGVEKLKELIAEAEAEDAKAAQMDDSELRRVSLARRRREANRLIRVQLTCMDDTKKDWPGEIFSVSNRVVGTIKKFIPFNAPNGYHIPQIMLKALEERRYQHFYTARNSKGIQVSKVESRPAFSITVLPTLEDHELAKIAQRQAAVAGTED